MKKRVLSLLLATSLLTGLLAGCGSDAENNKASESSAKDSVEESSATQSESEESEEVEVVLSEWEQLVANIPGEVPDFGGETFTFLSLPHWSTTCTYEEGFEIVKMTEELTNCKIDWITAPDADYMTIVQTRLLSGEPLDTFKAWYTNSQQYVDEGLILDFSDYADVAPNIMAWYEKNPSYYQNYGYKGGLWGLPVMRYESPEEFGPDVRAKSGLLYREDIALELGFTEVPTTIDDWFEMLSAVKEAYPDMIPYGVLSYFDSSVYTLCSAFAGAYGLEFNNHVYNTFFVDEDGKVQATFVQDAMRDFVAEMNKWYEAGLIGTMAEWNSFYDGSVFACWENLDSTLAPANLTLLRESCDKDDALFLLAPVPSVEGYDKCYGASASYNATCWHVIDSGDEEHNRKVVEFLDFFFFSPYGTAINQLGPMGELWGFDENGEFEVLDEEGLIKFKVTGGYVDEDGTDANTWGAGAWVRTPQNNSIPKAANDIINDYKKNELGETERRVLQMGEDVMRDNIAHECSEAVFAFVPEESKERLATVSGDFWNYSIESLNKFIVGEKDLSEWDDFVKTCYEDMHIGTKLEVYQEMQDAK